MQFSNISVLEEMHYLNLETKLCSYLVFISINLSLELKCDVVINNQSMNCQFEKVKLHFELFLKLFRTH